MLERDCWRFIQNRRLADADYLSSLGSVTNQEERETLWKNYLKEADQWKEECWKIIHSERQRLYNKRKDRQPIRIRMKRGGIPLTLFRSDSSTAFRLPQSLLAKIDGICDELDCTRSQLFRRSIKEYISFHELDRETMHHQPEVLTK